MSHYQHSLILDAPPATVYAALTTPEGLRGWWTEDCDVATVPGGMIQAAKYTGFAQARTSPCPSSSVRTNG